MREQLKQEVLNGDYDADLKKVYVSESETVYQRDRYANAIDRFAQIYGETEKLDFFSAPGRTEICGNHTDHNHGLVMAAGINLDAIAVVSKNDGHIIRVQSEGYKMDIIDLTELEIDKKEKGKCISLLRGICARFQQLGYQIGGFDAYTTSSVLSGSGLSSSAAYEVLLGTILNHLYNEGKVDPVAIAQIAQYAENVYFGKPCGLMDQLASSVGGFVKIDFKDTENPRIDKIAFDFSKSGHALCIVDTGGSHSDLTEEYAAVRKEMESIAKLFGADVLRSVVYADLLNRLGDMMNQISHRAILRAIHFFNENDRVIHIEKSLNEQDFDAFKNYITESGRSSYDYNQNIYNCKNPSEQRISLALAMSEMILKDQGACRVHGGGFAGTIQAFVPFVLLDDYKEQMEKVFGKDTCYILSVRPVGGIKVFG